MKIAFRHVPFTENQLRTLTDLAASRGCESILIPRGQVPDAQMLANCEILMGYFPPDLLGALPALKWLQVPAAGVDRLCGDIYARSDVVLTNCSGAFGVAISEYILTGILMLLRHMPAYLNQQQAHRWRSAGESRFIYGSTCTVVGLGNIGENLARRMKALGANVRAVCKHPRATAAYVDALYLTDALGEAVEGADVVAVCLPGTAETERLLSRDILARMKPDAIVVNVGRGRTIDETALVEALQADRLGGAVLDVMTVEPLPEDSPLWELPNVLLTPHISGHDNDALNAGFIFEIFRENLARYLNGQPLTHVVNRGRGY
jgi:phosphoglycerate dehydrogenase-like enzyme